MEKKEDAVQADIRFDLTRLIRSVQRIEGNPDCFGKADGRCDQTDCCWRSYCLHSSGTGILMEHPYQGPIRR